MKKRVFFAIDLPTETKETFTDFFTEVAGFKAVKWENPEKLHLTLIFLGYVDEKRINELTLLQSSNRVEYKMLTFRIIPKISAFPNPANPRVIWLPIEGDVNKLHYIVKQLAKALKDKKFHFDNRRFSAHLTLGRFRDWVKKEEKELIVDLVKKAIQKGSIEFAVTGLTLFESKLSPKGSVYKILAYEDFGN